MNSSWLAVEFILVNPSWSSAVTPLPCRFSTNARGEVPDECFGTCTITVRLKPSTLSDSVVEPSDVEEHPLDVAAPAMDAMPALKGTAASAKSADTATTPLTARVAAYHEKRVVTSSPFIQ